MGSLVYVSSSTLDYRRDETALEDIRLVSLARNSLLDVTGFLIATPAYFAQLLEGDGHALDALMLSIERDPRHSDVAVIERRDVEERRYPRWSMACFGPSSFVSRSIHPVLASLHRGEGSPGIPELRALIHQLVPSGVGPSPRPGKPPRLRA